MLAVLVIAICLRVGFVLFFGNTLSLQASGYDVYATNLLNGHGYTRFSDYHPDSDLPPLYSFFLAGIYLFLGHDAKSVALVQIVIDSISLTIVYVIGTRFAGKRVGLLAALLTACYPYLIFQNLSTNDTCIFIMLLTVGILAAYRVFDTGNWKWAVLMGIALGLAALTKTLVVLMVPIILFWWIGRLHLRRGFLLVLVAGLGLFVPIAPWLVRNISLHSRLVLISTNDGSNLYQGNNPCVVEFLRNGWDAQWVDCLELPPPGLSEIAESEWLRNRALKYLIENPATWPQLFAVKLWSLWSPELLPRSVPIAAAPKMIDSAVEQYETPAFRIARVIHVLYFGPLLILGLIGISLAWRYHKQTLPLIAVFLAITIAYLIYHPSTRYRSPADPFMFILSSYTIMWLFERAHARFSRVTISN